MCKSKTQDGSRKEGQSWGTAQGGLGGEMLGGGCAGVKRALVAGLRKLVFQS